MLEDELFQGAALQHDRIFVKGAYFSGKLDAVKQVDGHMLLAMQGGVEECLLNVSGKHMAVSLIQLGPRQR